MASRYKKMPEDVKNATAPSSVFAAIPTRQELKLQKQVDELVLQGKAHLFYDSAKMQEFAEKAYELAAQPNSSGVRYERGMAGAIGLLAARLSGLEDYSEALEQSMTGLALLDPNKPDAYRAELLSVLAESRFFMGDYAEGLAQEDEALKIFRELDEKTDEARLLSALAVMHYFMGHQDVSLESGEQAVRICRTLDQPKTLQMILNNLAMLYMEYDNLPSALTNAQESLSICELNGYKGFEPAVVDTLASIYIGLGDMVLAEEYARRGIEVSRTINDPSMECSAEIRLSQIYLARGQVDEAIVHANIALDNKKSIDKKWEMADTHQLLSELHEKNGNFAEAYFHMKELYGLEKARAKQQADGRVTELRVQHRIETAKKDAEIYRLRAIALEGEIEGRRLDQIRLETENSLDPATGLFNRRHLPVLQDKLHNAHKTHSPTSLLMLDIDHFKNVNDTYGHLTGDQVIAAIAQHLRSNIREDDVAVRFGGEEFLVFLPDTKMTDAVAIAEKIRKIIAAEPISRAGDGITVTVSIGVAMSGDAREEELRVLIDHADQALYQAKESGRNRVEMDGTHVR